MIMPPLHSPPPPQGEKPHYNFGRWQGFAKRMKLRPGDSLELEALDGGQLRLTLLRNDGHGKLEPFAQLIGTSKAAPGAGGGAGREQVRPPAHQGQLWHSCLAGRVPAASRCDSPALQPLSVPGMPCRCGPALAARYCRQAPDAG